MSCCCRNNRQGVRFSIGNGKEGKVTYLLAGLAIPTAKVMFLIVFMVLALGITAASLRNKLKPAKIRGRVRPSRRVR
jgi:hypothetical protein